MHTQSVYMPKKRGVGLKRTSSGEKGFHLGRPSIVGSVDCPKEYAGD